MTPAHKLLGTSKVEQQEPGNMKFSIYQKTLDDMGVEIFQGDYIGYYETEDRVRYYVVSDNGYVKSDNKHTYGGYKPFYRSVVATYVSENEFRGI
jgi:antirestriction protein